MPRCSRIRQNSGVRDLIVVVTPDATLVASKDNEESVRELIAELKKRGWEEYL